MGLPGKGDWLAVWGAGQSAARGRQIAQKRGAHVLTVEDAFLRSVHPGRAGDPPLGLLIDPEGLHSDPSRPSQLSRMLAEHPLDDPELLARAQTGIARIRALHLSKYSAFDPYEPVPKAGYVLVVDQTMGDASVRLSGGGQADFAAMLKAARRDHPGAPIAVKTHPETMRGLRPGYFTDLPEGVLRLDGPVSPWRLLKGARAVYTYSSQLGFEAILAGHRPEVFGQPFYAGWGLSHDRAGTPAGRGRRLTPVQLFAAAMILAPVWYDPGKDDLTSFEAILDILEAQTRAWREDRHGWTAEGIRLWKRPTFVRAFGSSHKIRFGTAASPAESRHMIWGQTDDSDVTRVEDGFLRSRGLGADLVPPMSLILDDLGIYYDPARESRLERLIAEAAQMPKTDLARARRLRATLRDADLSKYNLTGKPLPALPTGRRILVVGQTSDDAALKLGGNGMGNQALLSAARKAAGPGDVILWKPHPDVEAGLRPGAENDDAAQADLVLRGVSAPDALKVADEVWTISSLMGFEALLRGVPVTCLGAPFYAGWGLTRDLGPVPARREARPSLDALIHAALIAYPRYFDPRTGAALPVETVAERLASGQTWRGGPVLQLLSAAQNVLSRQAWIWRQG